MNKHHGQRRTGIFALAGLGVSLLTAMFAAAATDTTPAAPPEPFMVEDLALFIDQYCATCHNDVDTEGDLDITALKFTPEDPKNLEMWEKVYEQTKSGEMPPKEKRRPRESAVKDFLGRLGPALEAARAGK